MKNNLVAILIAGSLITSNLLAAGPTDTILNSASFTGKISGKTGNSKDSVCKLTIEQVEFTNDEYPKGPIKYQYINFRFFTGESQSAIDTKSIWESELLSRTNVSNLLGDSDLSPLPMKLGKQKNTDYNGETLYQITKRGDATYSGNTQIWISDIKPNVFEQKPTSVHIIKKGGFLFAYSTEADFVCTF